MGGNVKVPFLYCELIITPQKVNEKYFIGGQSVLHELNKTNKIK